MRGASIVISLQIISACMAGDPAALQRSVAAAVAAGAPSLTVAPGLYNFSTLPSGARTLDIAHASSFSLISGGDVEFLFPVDDGGLRVTSSSDVSLVGPFTLDRWPLFTTQGLVRDGIRDGKWYNFTLVPDAGFPLIDQARFTGSRALFFNATTRRTLPGQVLAVTSALNLQPVRGSSNWLVSVTFHANPTLTIPADGVLCALTPSSGSTSITIQNSTRFSAVDVTSYGSSAFTLLEVGGGGNNSYTRLKVTRRSTPGALGRLMASAADVFHSTAVAVGPTLIDSELSFAADDLFAVHCELGILWRRVNDTFYYVIDTADGVGMAQGAPGETLDFYGMNEDMPRLASAVLGGASFSVVTNATLIEEAQGAAEYIKKVLNITMRPFPVSLLLAELKPPGISLGDFGALVELPSRCGAGTLVRNSYLHDTNGGMRLKGSRVTVEQTVLENAYGMRMLPELFWTQSVSSNVTLRNNVLRGCGCTTLAPHAIEYNEDIIGLVLDNNTVYPADCT
jgi:hypothetical protein